MRPEKPQDKSLDELFALLKSHFESRIVVIAERFGFYQRLQRDSESIANYMAELRRLSKHCDFGDYLDTELRDQLLCGLYHEAVQRKILAESDLTLTKAVHIAQAAETARDETHALRGNTTRRPPAKQVESAFSVHRDTAGGAYNIQRSLFRTGTLQLVLGKRYSRFLNRCLVRPSPFSYFVSMSAYEHKIHLVNKKQQKTKWIVTLEDRHIGISLRLPTIQTVLRE